MRSFFFTEIAEIALINTYPTKSITLLNPLMLAEAAGAAAQDQIGLRLPCHTG